MALSWRELPQAMLHCVERHTEALRDSVQVQKGGKRVNTPEGADLLLFLTKVRLVFSKDCFRAGTFVVRRTYLGEVRERDLSLNASSLTARDMWVQMPGCQ